MLKICHIADSHFDERNRLNDNVAVHQAFLEQAAAANVDLIVHSGDVYERKSSPAERNVALAFFAACMRHAPVVIARGNHDAPGDLAKFQHLGCIVDERPGSEPFPGVGIGVRVLTLPWFDKANLVAQHEASATQQNTTHATIAAAQQMLTTLRAQASEARAAGLVPILVGHVQVAGSETSTGQTLIGQTVELDPGAIHDIGCEYAALGHIHKHQSWYGGRVCYAGSPQRNNFGEPEAKGWVLVTIGDDGKFASAEFRELPARRIELREIDFREWSAEKMAHLSTALSRADFGAMWGAAIQDQETFSGVQALGGALVRLRYRVRPEQLATIDEDLMTRALTDFGAHEVKLEAIVDVQERVRCEQIVTAQSLWEKVQAYLQAKQITLDDTKLDRLRSKLGTIESGDAVGREAA